MHANVIFSTDTQSNYVCCEYCKCLIVCLHIWTHSPTIISIFTILFQGGVYNTIITSVQYPGKELYIKYFTYNYILWSTYLYYWIQWILRTPQDEGALLRNKCYVFNCSSLHLNMCTEITPKLQICNNHLIQTMT